MTKQNNRIKKGIVLFLAASMLFILMGCGVAQAPRKVVLTTGFKKGEVFRIETASCYLPQALVYMTNIQNQYEQVYGEQIWDAEAYGVTLEQNVKDTVLAELAQIKTMNLMAVQQGVTLDDAEIQTMEAAAETYFSSLTKQEKELLGVSRTDIVQYYQEYALADKVYEYIIQEVNPEISDDEARKITLQQILIKTSSTDADGKATSYSEQSKAAAKVKISEALSKLSAGESFETVMDAYSEGQEAEFSVGKGEMSQSFETAAFNLGNGEISGIIEDEEGYHIIKCLSTLNREQTDDNKQLIVEERREETFSQTYDAYVQNLTRIVNQKLWDETTFIHDEAVTTSDFFDVYSEFTKN